MDGRVKILSVGEVLWDCFGDGRRLGGAPFNFAYYAAALGAEVWMVTAVGEDQAGDDLLATAPQHPRLHLIAQRDPEHPTGEVRVTLDADGVPTFEILEHRAWDSIAWTDEVMGLAVQADLVYFGSLAQRAPVSRQTIYNCLMATRGCLFCDLNLRPPFTSRRVVGLCLQLPHILKVSEAELAHVCRMKHIRGTGYRAARNLSRGLEFDLLCVTRGANGCWLCTPEELVTVPGEPAAVADTVGAGDAFAASLAVDGMAGCDLRTIGERANEVGALVASCPGAIAPLERIRGLPRCLN